MEWEVVGEQKEKQRCRYVKRSYVCGWVALWGYFCQESSYANLELLAHSWKFLHLFSLKGLVPGGQQADICVLTVALVVTLLIKKAWLKLEHAVIELGLSSSSTTGFLGDLSWYPSPSKAATIRHFECQFWATSWPPDASKQIQRKKKSHLMSVSVDTWKCQLHFCSSFHKQILGTDPPQYVKGHMISWLLIFSHLQFSGDGSSFDFNFCYQWMTENETEGIRHTSNTYFPKRCVPKDIVFFFFREESHLSELR